MYIICIITNKIKTIKALKIFFKFFSSSCGKEKNTWVKKAPKPAIGRLCSIQIQKEVISNQKQPSCKKRCGPQKGHGEKRCEIQGGGQEMAVMVG